MCDKNSQSILNILYDIFYSEWIWPLEIDALDLVVPNENKVNDKRRRRKKGKKRSTYFSSVIRSGFVPFS
jgi:hypothetical protein